MKAISIRELHERTGHWVREAGAAGEIRVSDHGKVIARIVAVEETPERPFFANREVSPAFARLSARGAFRGGTDSTETISADREDRGA